MKPTARANLVAGTFYPLLGTSLNCPPPIMKSLLLLQYNNYYNRIIKKEASVEAYCTDRLYRIISGVNFNPNDEVLTEQIINWSESWTPDYCIVLNEDNSINSRWFITKDERTRGKQYKLSLKRDTIVDYYDNLKDAPLFVQKGIIKDQSSPLVYNSENVIVNQIKSEETLLKDLTGVSWLVAYVAKNRVGTADFHGNVDRNMEQDGVITLSTTIANWKFYQFVNGTVPFISAQASIIRDYVKIGGFYNYYTLGPTSNNNLRPWDDGSSTGLTQTEAVDPFDLFLKYMTGLTGWEVITDKINEYLTYQKQADYWELWNLNGKIIKDSAGRYFRVRVNSRAVSNRTIRVKSNDNLLLHNYMSQLWNDANTALDPSWQTQTANDKAFQIDLSMISELIVTLEEDFNYAATWSGTSITGKTNAPTYDIICAPYGTYKIMWTESGTGHEVTNTKELSMALMQSICTNLGAGDTNGNIDLQLIPYCPIQGLINESENAIELGDASRIIKVIENDTEIGCAIVIPSVDQEFTIEHAITLDRDTVEGLGPDIPVSQTFLNSTRNTSFTNIIDVTGYEIKNINITVTDTGTLILPWNVQWAVLPIRRTNVRRLLITTSRSIAGTNRVAVSFTKNQIGAVNFKHSMVDDLKVNNDCTMYRLCSPNYNGIFEFNLVKNGANISYFNVDMTLKPFGPYIHVAPNFSGLYGSDYNDSRGLICGGDFTVSTLRDAWREYEIQNRNYQNIFDRQIQNMDEKRSIEKLSLAWNRDKGVISSIFGIAGGLAGQSAGALIGGTVGIGMSLANYQQQMAISGKAYKENRDFATDMYELQLGNVKALPNSVVRTNALTANNKIFPFIEKYTCTEVEKEALRNKMQYEGMNIGIISTLAEWQGEDTPAYVKGQLIRIENFNNNYVLEDIAMELAKGVYI